MSVTGADAIRAKIRRVKDAIEGGGLFMHAVNQWAESDYKPYAKSIAPEKTGAFKNSIDVEVTKNQAHIVAPVPHGPFVEYGSSRRAAQPTLVPALNATRAKLSARLQQATRNLLK